MWEERERAAERVGRDWPETAFEDIRAKPATPHLLKLDFGTTPPEALLEHSLRFAPQTLRWLTANCLVAMFAET